MSTYYPGVLTNPGAYNPGVLTDTGAYYPGVLTIQEYLQIQVPTHVRTESDCTYILITVFIDVHIRTLCYYSVY